MNQLPVSASATPLANSRVSLFRRKKKRFSVLGERPSAICRGKPVSIVLSLLYLLPNSLYSFLRLLFTRTLSLSRSFQRGDAFFPALVCLPCVSDGDRSFYLFVWFV